MTALLKRLFYEEDGQGMVEYGLIIALVAVVLIGALVALRGGLSNIFQKATDTLNNPPTTVP
ncbi:MAG: Flp family type IVb pilin [Betaproteobacteria bacterium]